jgi:hypothetical protein
MADPVPKHEVETTVVPRRTLMKSGKAQSGPHVAHSRIVLIPHPSDDPRDPLVCLNLN